MTQNEDGMVVASCSDGVGYDNGHGCNYITDDNGSENHPRDGNGGSGSGTGEGYSHSSGAGDGDGWGEGKNYGTGHGHSDDCNGITADSTNILFEIGVPKLLHELFLPLTEGSLLAAQDFTQAETQEQRDAVLGVLELEREITDV